MEFKGILTSVIDGLKMAGEAVLNLMCLTQLLDRHGPTKARASRSNGPVQLAGMGFGWTVPV
jgi:hypothetical protein